ncbi:MAG: hypothetical protein WCP06_11035 [Verrucomicrobiota bacterium]
MKPLICLLALLCATPLRSTRGATFFENSFEQPEIFGRKAKSDGGDFARQGARPDWRHFNDCPNAAGEDTAKKDAGAIIAGVTSDMARTGNQSCFVEAQKLAMPYTGVVFSSRPFAVLAGKEYVVGIWGRIDAKTPLTTGSSQLYVKLQADFFAEDSTTQTGESNYLVQAVPGTANHAKLFIDSAWRQLSRRVTAPDDARFMSLTVRVESGPESGVINGVMYFDDVSVEGDLSPLEKDELSARPDAPADESAAEEPAVQSATPEAASPVATPSPAAPAAPADAAKKHVFATPPPVHPKK